MCKKREKYHYQNKPTGTYRTPSLEADALIQMLRIRIWKIIARNNADDLVDPMLNPLKNPAPYVQKAKLKNSQVKKEQETAEITPSLDEVLPLPKKTEQKPAPKKEDTKPVTNNKKKTSAKDLLSDEENDELPGQITVDEAIEEADGLIPQSAREQENPRHVENKAVESSSKPNKPTEQKEAQEESKTPTLRERYLESKIARCESKTSLREQNQYFKLLAVQIQNKNAACFEILDYLDELQNED